MSFVQEGQKSGSGHQAHGATCGFGDCWLMSQRQLHVPKWIVVTTMRPEMVLYSDSERIVYFIELTISFEDAIFK